MHLIKTGTKLSITENPNNHEPHRVEATGKCRVTPHQRRLQDTSTNNNQGGIVKPEQ